MHLANALAFIGLVSVARAGSVLVVDPNLGPFTDIQPAVDASRNGDVVLVKSGVYSTFAVASRAIAVVADSGASVQIQGGVRVRNLDPGETFVVAGLTSHGNPVATFDRYGFSGLACAGSIRIQDCEFFGANGAQCAVPPANGVASGARFQDCADVSIVDASCVGGAVGSHGWPDLPPTGRGGAGVDARGSRIALDRVAASGLAGGAGCCDGGSGGHGIVTNYGTQVFASECTFRGGNGANGFCAPFGWGGSGGHGLYQEGPCPQSTITRTIQCTLSGGTAGWGTCSIFCDPHDFDGSPGSPSLSFLCATHVTLSGAAPSVRAPSVVRENSAVVLELRGEPGDRLALRIARATSHTWDAALNGVVLVQADAGTTWLDLGTVAPDGTATYSLGIPSLPPGEQVRVFHVQIRSASTSGVLQLGSARSLVILDSAY